MTQARRVKDVMNPDIMTVADEMTTDELVRYLTEHEISGAPVVDGQGRFVGVVSMTDIGRHLAEPSDFASEPTSQFYRDPADDTTLEDLGQRFVEERAVTVRDVMTPAVHQVPATASGGGGRSDHGRAPYSPVGRHTGPRAGGYHHQHRPVAGTRRPVVRRTMKRPRLHGRSWTAVGWNFVSVRDSPPWSAGTPGDCPRAWNIGESTRAEARALHHEPRSSHRTPNSR